MKSFFSIHPVPKISNYNSNNFFLIAGPCVIENKEMPLAIATHLKAICEKLEIPLIFKASYRKANRSSNSSFTGIGDEQALELIAEVGRKLSLPTITDIHTAQEASLAAMYVDALQIPAFLCRQTDLLEAAAETGLYVNIKKGQFLSPESMKFAVEKVRAKGNQKVMITERGTTFGYQDLVIDYRGVIEMQKNQCPVILDVTHSLQLPNQQSGVTGGRPDLITTIASAGIATGFDGLFIETHPTPNKALSDGANMLQLDLMENLLLRLTKIRKAIL
ncbi:MAG: 3-deoxy-8-phosphooctulonate synthase [Bacteroidota bacterium]|jgi:2-dehydro-3-deoxyphosphooctonate aldolase (KDO 8-P synthase)